MLGPVFIVVYDDCDMSRWLECVYVVGLLVLFVEVKELWLVLW